MAKLKMPWGKRREMVALGKEGMFVMVFTSAPATSAERMLLGEYQRHISARGSPLAMVEPGDKVRPDWVPVVAMGVPDLRVLSQRFPQITELPSERIVTNWGLSWQQSGFAQPRHAVCDVLELAIRIKAADTDEDVRAKLIAELRAIGRVDQVD